MAIKQRQKDIINPYAQDAERYNSSERNGVGYDYSGTRNKFVIDAIHDSFRNLGFFPEIGTIMLPVGPLENLTEQERTLSQADALAYCALYPQNAKIIGGKFKLLSDDEIYNQLKKIANILASENVSESYETVTTSEAQFIENQTIIPSNTGREKITYNSLEEKTAAARKQTVARLISIPPVHSSKYTNSLRKSLAAPEISYEIEDNLYLYNNSGLIPYTSQNANVDLYDWRNNADPGTETTKVYYNPIDDNYYYIVRTDSTDPQDYVVSFGGTWSPNENTASNLKSLLRKGVDEILKFTQKYSDQNRTALISVTPTQEQVVEAMLRGTFLESNQKLSLLTYMNERPSSPWVGCVKMPRVQLDALPGGFEVSYEEFEMTPFEKARVIINGRKPEYRLPIQVNSLIGKLAATKKVLKRYLRDIIIENIPRKMLKNVDIEREIDNLHNFINYLQLLYNYNRLSLDDDDLIEFYLTDTFQLMYVSINGNLITRGIGNTDFASGDSDDVMILDAFGLMSQTSFSFVFYSPYIFKEYLEKPDSSGRSWVDFLGTYMYPPLDTTALSTQLQANKKKDESLLNQKRQQNVFQKVSEISRIPSRSIEEMYFKRPLRYKLENLENNIQCSTAQARYAKYALGIAKAFTTQTKIKSITRQVILILKNEVISDAVKRAKISIDGQELGLQDAENLGFRYADNPELIRRDVEKYVNERIFCSLDVIGDFIEDSFLDPIGAPPAANDLVRATLDPPIKFEFKERPTFSLVDGRRKAYEKVVSGIVENFLNALLAGIIRDLINAFLGCGPNTTPEDSEQLKNSAAQINYGGVEIREFLSDTDIVEKATEAGLVSPSPGGDVEVTFQQMANFLDDVSKILTPSEATALLRGDAPAYLYQVILEMVSRIQPIPIRRDTEIITESYGTINFDADNLNVYFELLGGGNPTTEAYSSINPVQSYCDDKDVQASDLGLDFLPEEQLIVQFDEAMQNKMLKISFFCDFLRNALDFQAELDKLMDLIPSMGWYDDLLGSIAEFSNFLADQLADLFSGGSDSQVPAPIKPFDNFYTTKLGSQVFWGVNRGFLINHTVPDTPLGVSTLMLRTSTWIRTSYSLQASQENGELYSWADKFGVSDANRTSWFQFDLPGYDDYKTSDTMLEHANITKYTQTYGTPLQISISRNDSNPSAWELEQRKRSRATIALVFRGTSPSEEQMRNRLVTNAGIGYSIVNIEGPYDAENRQITTDFGGPLLASDPLSGREVSNDLFGQFESLAPNLNYSILASFFMDNLTYRNLGAPFEQPLEIDISNEQMRNTRNQFAMNINAWSSALFAGPERTPNNPRQGYTQLNRNLLTFGNAYRNNENYIETFYTSMASQRTLPPFVRAVNKFPFNLAGDECVTAREELIASSIVSSLQVRIARVLFNAGPLLTVYPYWGSDATIYMLNDYLLRKFEADYSQRKLLGAIYDNLEIVEKAYSNPREDLNRGFRLYKDRTPRENLRILIRCVLYRMLDNIATGTEYTDVNRSLFDNEHGGVNRFTQLAASYFQRMVELYRDVEFFPQYEEKYQYLYDLGFGPDGDEAQFLQAGYYFFPIAHLYAANIITWDVADLSWGIKDLDLQLNSQKAQADDSILTALNGVLSTQFSSNFSGFPVTITDYEGTPRTYYSREEANERVQYLERNITNIENSELPPSFSALCGYSETVLQSFLKDATGFDYKAHVANLWDNGWEEREIHGRGDPGVETKAAAQNSFRSLIYERMQTLCSMYNAPDIATALERLNATYRPGGVTDEEFTERYTLYTQMGYSTLEPSTLTPNLYFETMENIINQASEFVYGGFPEDNLVDVDPYLHIYAQITRDVSLIFNTYLRNLYATGTIDEIQINIAGIQGEINTLSRYI